MIPKVIYQIWCYPMRKENSKIPDEIQITIDNMLDMNPGFEYKMFIDDEMTDFIIDHYDEKTLNAFNSLEIGAAKADFFRYLLLYIKGGVYIDISKLILKPIGNLINCDYAIITREGNPGLFVQWCLMYPPKHEILKICIEKIISNIEKNKKIDVTILTGPVVYSDSVSEYLNDKEVYYKSDSEINLNEDVTKVRFFGFDYNGHAHYLHPFRHLLYNNTISWRDEQKEKYNI